MPQPLPGPQPCYWWLLELWIQLWRALLLAGICLLVAFNHYFIKGEGVVPSDNLLWMLWQCDYFSTAALPVCFAGTFTY